MTCYTVCQAISVLYHASNFITVDMYLEVICYHVFQFWSEPIIDLSNSMSMYYIRLIILDRKYRQSHKPV